MRNKVPFKQIIREELNILGIELHMHYFNDLTNRLKKTTRRIKVGVDRSPSARELDMVTDCLSKAFKCTVDAKTSMYWGTPTVVFYLRR